MTEDLEIETYLSISNSIIGIYLFDIKRLKNLYKNEIKIENQSNILDTNILNSFLEENVFKIEKLLGEFINNIYLIVENNKTNNIYFGIKKKVYGNKIDKKYLENLLTDAKDLFNENYKNEKIMHIVINKFKVDNKNYLSFEENIIGDNFCLELQFRSISNLLTSEINKSLEKYHIKIINYIDGNYLKNLFNKENMEIAEMAHKAKIGFNSNEVKLVPKNTSKIGLFEKFFQLFS